MLRGIYTGASGMKVGTDMMDALANNLANVNVTGYKRDTAVQKSFPELLIRRLNDNGLYKFPFGSVETAPVVGKIGTGVEFNELYTVFEQGSMQETENVFDLSLDGEGFFTVQTPRGVRFTRNGSFTLDKSGILVTKDGYPVLGENGAIQIKENNFVIDTAGRIFINRALQDDLERLVSAEENEWEEMEQLDILRVVDFENDRYLKKEGSSLWANPPEAGASFNVDLGGSTKVLQGFLETSNVDPVREMVDMIEINRLYEANQKAIQTHDQMASRFINDVMKI